MKWTPPARPEWMLRMNAHAEAVGGSRYLVSLDPEELICCARAGTGLDDFGEGEWRSHYDVLMPALEDEAELHLAGRLVVRTEVLRSLRNRLQLCDLWTRRPEILEDTLAPPVFVVGSPRSGTSILHELMACDPASRSPSMWEMMHPVESLGGDSLRDTGDRVTRFWNDLQPEYESMHANSGDLPNECIFITMNEFLSDQWGGCHAIPSYQRYLNTTDHRPAYRFHERFLRTLQQRSRGERWLLKAPSHLSQLRALFDVYPGARIVRTHRDPLKTIPSALSLMGTLKWMRGENAQMERAPKRLAFGYADLYAREIEERAAGVLPDDRFVDVRYHDLLADPVETIRGVYEGLGWRLSNDVAQSIRDYIAAKPKASRGAHRYSLEEMGLDPASERERFRDYQERFQVPDEA